MAENSKNENDLVTAEDLDPPAPADQEKPQEQLMDTGVYFQEQLLILTD